MTRHPTDCGDRQLGCMMGQPSTGYVEEPWGKLLGLNQDTTVQDLIFYLQTAPLPFTGPSVSPSHLFSKSLGLDYKRGVTGWDGSSDVSVEDPVSRTLSPPTHRCDQ